MAAEFFVRFENRNWYINNKNLVIDQIKSLNTYTRQLDNEFWLKGINDNIDIDYDVRIFLDRNDYIMLEISYHPLSIEKSLKSFLNWIRMQTNIIVQDDDGDISTW